MTMTTTAATTSAQKSKTATTKPIGLKLKKSLLVGLSNYVLLKHCKGMLKDITTATDTATTIERTRLIDMTSQLYGILSNEQESKCLLIRLSNDVLLKHCKGMLEDIFDELIFLERTQLIDKTSKLFYILSDGQKRKYRNIILLAGGSSYDKEIEIPTSIVVNHLLPFLDHHTWKSVSFVSIDIYETIQQQKLCPPWPVSTDIIRLESDAIDDLCFDHDKGNRLVILRATSVSLYDSRRGFIKNIDFSTVVELEEGATDGLRIYLLDATTFLLELEMNDRNNYLYMYRIIEEIPVCRKNVGVDIIPFPNQKVAGGPWLFHRNGSTYIATAHKSTNSNMSDKIVIHRYRGGNSWPNCLQQTHCLFYPTIEISEGEQFNPEELQYLRLPSTNKQQQNDTEIIVLVSVTKKDVRHVHYWRLCSDQLRIHNISPISCGIIPSLQTLGNESYYSNLKIVPSPYGSNQYSFRILEFWEKWWEDYDDDKEECIYDDDSDDDLNDLNDDNHMTMIESYNEPNIIVWDYHIHLQQFVITNILSLMEGDGFPLLYNSLNTSNDGQYLLSHSESEGLGVCRLNNLKPGQMEVHNFKNIVTHCDSCAFFKYYGDICHPNDNKLAILYNYQSKSIQVTYLYLNSL